MAEEIEPIRAEIAATRDSMAETLDQIEARVRDNVDQKVAQVRESVHWRTWVEEHPLGALAAAVSLGFWLGRR